MIAIDRIGFGYSDFGQAENLKTQANIIEKFVKTNIQWKTHLSNRTLTWRTNDCANGCG